MFLLLLALGWSAFADPVLPEFRLTDPGFLEVASRYRAFEATNLGCRAEADGPRVLLTGFGLFDGVRFNVTGALIANLARPSFWPGPPARGYSPLPGILRAPEQGARVMNRVLDLHGRKINACLILTDVFWDFSGAVVATEMERFQPDLVVMLGQAPEHAILEASARNLTSHGLGFYSNGTPDTNNRPVESVIVPGEPDTLPMTWDNQALAASIRPDVDALGKALEAPQFARPSNNYVCNNMSYIALTAARGETVYLDDGDLVLKPKVLSHPQVGFMHIPKLKRLDGRKLWKWTNILLKLVDTALKTRPTLKTNH